MYVCKTKSAYAPAIVSHAAADTVFICVKRVLCERIFQREKMNSNNSSNISNVGFEKCFIRPIVHSPSSSYIKSHIAICVVNVLFSIVGTILNSLVLYIFWKSPQRRSKMSSFAIMVLCSVDLGVATIVQPLFAFFLINEILGKSKCLYLMAFVLMTFVFAGLSISTLATINIQRYFSIVHPILHRNVGTKRRFLLTNFIVWFIYLLTYLSRILAHNYSWISTVVLVFIISSTSFFVYLSIFLVARKKLGKMCQQVNDIYSSDQDQSINLMSFLRELKLAKIYILIVLLQLLCYLPYSIVLLYRKLESTMNEMTIGATDWTLVSLYMNSTLNCCVFFWANRELRKESVKIIRKCFGERYV